MAYTPQYAIAVYFWKIVIDLVSKLGICLRLGKFLNSLSFLLSQLRKTRKIQISQSKNELKSELTGQRTESSIIAEQMQIPGETFGMRYC